MSEFLSARAVSKTYRLGRVDVPVLREASISLRKGEWVAILGASGSGKSTLLHLLGGLDRPDRESRSAIVYEDRALSDMSARELDRYRAHNVGFIFQFYHLLPELNVIENVLVASMVARGRLGYRLRRRALRERASDLLGAMGLSHRLSHRPAELSGGERQRVAIARALMNEPDVLLADEPTGNLDHKTGQSILDGIAQLRRQRDQTILMVTHDPAVAARAGRVVHLRDGRVVEGRDERSRGAAGE
ncbi:MAG: ABC transporter ATP-binding protein [Phycisphaeraceae bacterium]|nr:ABC transporter ATP-binding protein [Phycisphaeraceae bacterium]